MTQDSGFNLDERLNCSDDACIGLVGADGKCKVCGALYVGNEPLPDPQRESRPEQEDDDDEQSVTAPTIAADDQDEYFSPEDRVCCPDETCIGIIGPTGACGTCGKRV